MLTREASNIIIVYPGFYTQGKHELELHPDPIKNEMRMQSRNGDRGVMTEFKEGKVWNEMGSEERRPGREGDRVKKRLDHGNVGRLGRTKSPVPKNTRSTISWDSTYSAASVT